MWMVFPQITGFLQRLLDSLVESTGYTAREYKLSGNSFSKEIYYIIFTTAHNIVKFYLGHMPSEFLK